MDSFQFIYDETRQAGICNDVILLKNHNPFIKLVISHAIAQSTKLSLFEYKMDEAIEYTHIPKIMAETGKMPFSKKKILQIIGLHSKLKADVNLVSNLLGIFLSKL